MATYNGDGKPTDRMAKPTMLSIRIDPSLAKQMKIKCIRNDLSVSDYMRELVIKDLNNSDKTVLRKAVGN